LIHSFIRSSLFDAFSTLSSIDATLGFLKIKVLERFLPWHLFPSVGEGSLTRPLREEDAQNRIQHCLNYGRDPPSRSLESLNKLSWFPDRKSGLNSLECDKSRQGNSRVETGIQRNRDVRISKLCSTVKDWDRSLSRKESIQLDQPLIGPSRFP